jgi:hypothetical protein
VKVIHLELEILVYLRKFTFYFVNKTIRSFFSSYYRLTECGLYKGTYQTKCAPRWTSPEAVFSSKFSSRSDVWSYVR